MMDNTDKVVTIKQVAEEVGVSIGTVDRVLHNRGRVSDKTREKVLETIKKLGFSPDLRASVLSKKQDIRLSILLPFFQNGDYWSMMENGIHRAVSKFKNLKLETDIIYFDQFNEKSFVEAERKCLKNDSNAVVLTPIFRERSAAFVNDLSKSGIPVIFLDTKIDGSPYTAFYGIDLEASAHILADLIFRNGKKPDKIFDFYIEHKNAPLGEAFYKRTEGFKKFIKDKGIDCELIKYPISPTDFYRNLKNFDRLVQEHPDVHCGITMTSRASIIADWLSLRKIQDFELYGFDATPANVNALKKGYINTLISQRTADEACDAVEDLITYLLTGKVNVKRDILYPIDILTKYNIDFYNIEK